MLLDVYVYSLYGSHSPDPQHRASDDVTNPEKVRSLLQDIREARQAKSREGVSKLDHSELSVRIRCSSSTPICTYSRPRHSSRISAPWRSTRSDRSSYAPWAS